MHYCFTGPRKITYQQEIKICRAVSKLAGESYHVGDALGTDKVVREFLQGVGEWPITYKAEGRLAWQFAKRSAEMVRYCHRQGGAKLLAFPNKNCPIGVAPRPSFNGKGSGTWGTIAYASHLGLEIEIIFLENGLTEPDWLREKQLNLFG